MAGIFFGKQKKIDKSIKAKAYTFMEKLQTDDTAPGLHIEPIVGAQDSRVRTGRVDDNFRAVMFKVTAEGSVTYVMHGFWKHDVANRIAESVMLTVNPLTGIAEIKTSVDSEALEAAAEASAGATAGSSTPTPTPTATSTQPEVTAGPGLLEHYGLDAEKLIKLGLDEEFARAAMTVSDESALMALVERCSIEWQGLALIDLSAGKPIEEVKSIYGLDRPVDESGTEDEQLLRGLEHPASQLTFAWIEDNEELRRAIEESEFAAWRTFLHPLQAKFVERDFSGASKITGGAGTGKTVVALHRARRLAKEAGSPRVVLTTYTTNLAASLQRDIVRLDPDVALARRLGEPGLRIDGVDALIRAVLAQAGAGIATASEAVLGYGTTQVLQRTGNQAWDEAIEAAGQELPDKLRSAAFFAAEYGAVVLPRRVKTETAYFRAPRRGRGVALSRGQRVAVWAVIESYRASSRARGTIDFEEAAAIAAEQLDIEAETGSRLADQVLVDEGQDLVATRWQFLRALVAPGPNDLFIAEDSHQRIYGQKITLSHLGIQTQGKSRRLTLNYRTTAQNLRWAMSVLDGSSFSDIDGDSESHDTYRSARSGPVPVELACGSMTDELDQAAELLKGWLADPDVASAPETVAVLVRDQYQRERVVNGLEERGVDVRPVDRDAIRAGSPVAMTMHRAKGTEFARVLLFGVRDGSLPSGVKKYDFSEADLQDALLRERSLLYVAASRARDVLAISWSGQKSSLLSD